MRRLSFQHKHPTLTAVVVLIAICCLLLLSSPLTVAADTLQIVPSQPLAQESNQPIDVVVVLDDSGSMATCWPWPRTSGQTPFYPPCGSPSPNEPSDPNNLRYSAARLLVQLADAEDRVAVIRFDTVAEGIGAMGDLQLVGADDNRQALIRSLQPPTDYFRRGYTRIDLGLQLAMDLLEGSREAGRNQYIVLLTDGEPTHPNGPEGIQSDIAAQVDELVADGVLTFPVVLCNPTAGCQGDFLREVFADFGISEATTAESLLRIFSDVLTEMKTNRSVISGRNGRIQVDTRASQAVDNMAYITEQGGLLELSRNGEQTNVRAVLSDPNIDVNVVDTPGEGDAQWNAAVAESGGFVVVEADSYPELLNPPPSIAQSAASTRYYPEGKLPLLIARGVGPAASEPMFYNGQQMMRPFGLGELRYLVPDKDPGVMRLQLGENKQPLQLERSFRVEPRAGLPLARVLSPSATNDGRLPDGRMRLQVGFGGSEPVKNMAASVYVFETEAAATTNSGPNSTAALVHTNDMACNERVCTDESFLPEDGHNYEVTFIVKGEIDDLRFGDWAQTNIGLEPAVYLRGLPESLDLAQMPEGGWPVDLASGTVESIGMLNADIVLTNVATGEQVKNVSVDFMHDVPEEGSLSTTLFVEGLEALRPGEYQGEIVMEAKSPSGLPMDVRIRPAPEIPVTLSAPRPVAHVRSQALDFGDVLFDTSPNFRLDEEAFVTVDFSHKVFPLTAQLVGEQCPSLSITTGAPETLLGSTVIPLRLTSPEPVSPGACSGQIRFSGPDGDHDVTPNSVDWQVRVSDVEWSLVDGALDLGDLQDAGTRIEETLQVRFSGKTPFLIQMDDIEAVGSNVQDGAPSVLTSDYIEMPAVEVSGPPQADGSYLVPITLIARQAIPHDPLRGTYYTGQLGLTVAGLGDAAKPVTFAFRSPSVYQRYAAPIVEPVYSLPWVLCTAPLTLLLLLVVVARMRGRDFDAEEVEQAAMATAAKTLVSDASEAKNDDLFVPSHAAASAESTGQPAWGGSEWGSVWTSAHNRPIKRTDQAEGLTSSGLANESLNGHSNGHSEDPWKSSW